MFLNIAIGHSFPLLHDRGWQSSLETQPCLLAHLLMDYLRLLSPSNSRVASLRQRPYGTQSLKDLLSGSLQKEFAECFYMIFHLINAALFSHPAYDGQCVVSNFGLL